MPIRDGSAGMALQLYLPGFFTIKELLIINLDTEPQIEMSEDEKPEFVASRILREHRAASEVLAK